MTIEEKVECDARELARQFYYQYAKTKPCRIEQFISKKGKWWKYFFEAADKFSRREEWDCESFIKSQFDKNDLVYPPQLKTDKAWETFLEFKIRNGKVNEEAELARSLLSGFRALGNKSMKDFLSLKSNTMRLFFSNYSYDIRAFCFSKTFIEFYEENGNKFEIPIKMGMLKIRIRNYPRLMNAIQKKLGDDFEP